MSKRKVKEIEMKIMQDSKQTRVAIPARLVERLNITQKDRFLWTFIEEGNQIFLVGSLKKVENEKKN